jgi:hypothetical protein
MKFYLGFGWESKIRKENTYPLGFVSVACNYSYNSYKKLTGWKINGLTDLMLDSGGFSFLNRFGDYPISWNMFVDWVHKMNDVNNGIVSYVATPDYPCEKEITRTCELATNFERIIKTIDNAVVVMDKYPDIKWMPVIQGYNFEEYKQCLDLYRSRGINPEKFAIGSMCRRSDVRQIEQYVKKLIEYGLKEKIHLFGLCAKGLKSKYLDSVVDSSDSISYTYNVWTQGEKDLKKEKMIETIGGYILKNKEQITLFDSYRFGEVR